MDMRIYKNDDEIYILELQGKMDLYNSGRIRETVMKIIEKKTEGLILDLKGVDAIRSAGIGVLINISSTLKKLNYSLVITNASSVVQKAMEVTKLKGYLPITPTLKEAIDRINEAKA